MAIGRAALLRPIEITASSDSFSTTVSGFVVNYTMESGTYASILTLAGGLYDKLSGLSGFAVTFGTSGATAGYITISSSATFALTWTDTELRDILGFSGNLSGQTSYTATYRPKYTWISDYTPRDREWWHLNHRETYNGSVARNGDLVGLANGNQIYYRTLGFDAETGANVFNSLTGSTAAERYTLETMIEGARGAAPATATNAPTHGLWYVYDIADLARQTKAQMTAANGRKHGLSKWAWCHLDKDGMKEPKASLGVGRDWYSLEIDLHTADEPTWDAPTPPS
jgi:hypothetical protein